MTARDDLNRTADLNRRLDNLTAAVERVEAILVGQIERAAMRLVGSINAEWAHVPQRVRDDCTALAEALVREPSPPATLCECGHPHIAGSDGEDGGCRVCRCVEYVRDALASPPPPATQSEATGCGYCGGTGLCPTCSPHQPGATCHDCHGTGRAP